MKSSTRLESAVFQLTPTRTRCDLFIVAHGKKEKVASGLLNPFVAHLKTAEDQIAKGGYSILLEPGPDDGATWFTKGTVERFVRFVSTPEILERVYTIESEIAQIEKAISLQGNNDNGLSTVEDHQTKPAPRIQGSNSAPDIDEQKAIVLYTPGSQANEANVSVTQEGNSKVQLLKVLETRISVLQKEQGMAFARAAAAGFDIDDMASLISFAKCFGASRLMDACLRFLDLWKRKHESGQWLEIEETEAMSSKSEFSAINASGIILSSMANKQNDLQSELASESNKYAGVHTSTDIRPPLNRQIPFGQQEYYTGQFAHPMFPSWPMHPPPGNVPLFQGYPPMQTPYYQNYSGNGPYHQPSYQPVEESQLNLGQRAGQKRQSMDGNVESKSSETDTFRVKSDNDLEKETSHRKPQKAAGRSGKKQSGVVVIRNINYITSEQKGSSGSDSSSGSESDDGGSLADTPNMRHKDHARSSRRNEEEASDADGHWNAFQNCLLRDTDEDNRTNVEAMFAREQDVQLKRPEKKVADDPLAFVGRNTLELQGPRSVDFHNVGGNASHFSRASNDELSVSRREGPFHVDHLVKDDMQFTDVQGRRILYPTGNDELLVARGDGQPNFKLSSDLAINGYEVSANNSAYIADESFIVPFRSMTLDQVGSDSRAVVDIISEHPSAHQNSETIADKTGNRVNYEPDGLSLLPERGSEKRSFGYDPALEYEKQFCLNDAAAMDAKSVGAVADVKQGLKKTEKERRSKMISETSDKKKNVGPIRKGKSSKMSPLEEARVRAEKLRTYKADLQKLKKEKEEAEQKRIEALKMERQKRIAARGNLTSAQSLPSTATRKSLPTKLSPISHRGSKFSDSEPGSSSPLQRSKIRTALRSADFTKAPMISKSGDCSHLTENKLIRSSSSLSESKKEANGVTPDSKVSMARIRRLSEPKTIISHPASSVKTRSAESMSKPKESDGCEGKKVTAIKSLDRSKATSLPELKIKTSKGTSTVNQKKSAKNEMTSKVIGGKSSITSESDQLNTNDDRILHHDLDDNPVIEKTVVMLEYQKPSISAVPVSAENMGISKRPNDNIDVGDKTAAVPEFTGIHKTSFPTDRVYKEPPHIRTLEKHSSEEVMTSNVKMLPLFGKAPIVRTWDSIDANHSRINTYEKPYQAPIAWVSSMEDPCTRNSEYGKAQPSSLGPSSTETSKIHVSDFETLKLEQIPEVFEKSPVKESSKGFRRFLKLGRKHHGSTTGEQTAETDNASIHESEQEEIATKAHSSVEVNTLKNLISQDETPTAGNASSQKSSRHFSLLSPFRSKTTEKKLKT